MPAHKVSIPQRWCAKESCKKLLVRREGESTSNFKRRTHCSRSCACILAARVKGTKLPKKTVPCSHKCGAMLLRAVHLVDAACDDCKKKEHRLRENAANERNRLQARCYRILMSTLGFDSFEETMEYLRAQSWTVKSGKRYRDLRIDASAA